MAMANSTLFLNFVLCNAMLHLCCGTRMKPTVAARGRSKQLQGHHIGSVSHDEVLEKHNILKMLDGRYRFDGPAFMPGFFPAAGLPAQGRSMLPRTRPAPLNINVPSNRAPRFHALDQMRMDTAQFLSHLAGTSKVQTPQSNEMSVDLTNYSPGKTFPPGTEFDGKEMKHLGMGQFGDVWQATDPETGEEVVVKIFHLRTGETEWQYLTWNMADKRMKWTMRKSIEECKLVQKMVDSGKTLYPSGASHICACKDEHISEGITNPNGLMYTVWEKAGREDLTTLKLPAKLEDRVQAARSITKQVAEVLTLLSMLDPPLIHHDLKPDNIMVSGEFSEGLDVKLIDFGCFIPATEEMRTSISMGDPIFMPPEHYWDNAFADPPSSFDIWALGLIHLQLICPEYTHDKWYPGDAAPTAESVMQGLQLHCKDMFDHDKFEMIAEDLHLIERCLSLEPSARPKPSEVVERLAANLYGTASSKEVTTFNEGDAVEMLVDGEWKRGIIAKAGVKTYDIGLCDDGGATIYYSYTDVEPGHVKAVGKAITIDVPDVRPSTDMFSTAPNQWNLGQTHVLGTDTAKFAGKAVLVDQTSVSDVIDQLNAHDGDAKIKEARKAGFCVIWSASQSQYFLLYTNEAKEAAGTAVDINFDVPDVPQTPDMSSVAPTQWNLAQTHVLGTDEARFAGKAVLVDQTSVSDVIDRLNANDGDAKIQEARKAGFCIIWSASQSQYFLLYTSEDKQAACTALDITTEVP